MTALHEGSLRSEKDFCPTCMTYTDHIINTELSVVSHCTVCGLTIDMRAYREGATEREALVRKLSAQGHYGNAARRDWSGSH